MRRCDLLIRSAPCVHVTRHRGGRRPDARMTLAELARSLTLLTAKGNENAVKWRAVQLLSYSSFFAEDKEYMHVFLWSISGLNVLLHLVWPVFTTYVGDG